MLHCEIVILHSILNILIPRLCYQHFTTFFHVTYKHCHVSPSMRFRQRLDISSNVNPFSLLETRDRYCHQTSTYRQWNLNPKFILPIKENREANAYHEAAMLPHDSVYVMWWLSSSWLYAVLPGLILGLRPANERRRYFVTASLIGCAQA